MSLSQFTVYSSSDRQAPVLNGFSGSLLNVLNACLVNGYGSKSPAGWSKPLPTDPTQSIACYQPASGSRLILIVHDNNPTQSFNSQAGAQAWWCGWEVLYGLTGSSNTALGSGSGNFPLITQLGTGQSAADSAPISASYVVQKSFTADSTQRVWIMFADASTMHLFIASGTVSGVYSHYHFGDIYSLKGPGDAYRCWITGRLSTAGANGTSKYDASDTLPAPISVIWPTAIARAVGGQGQSVIVNKISDSGKAHFGQSLTNPCGSPVSGQGYLAGVIPSPNPVDNSLYLSPIWIMESSVGQLRGRVRGMWMMCHAIANFSDGQIIYGANELAGKVFQMVVKGPNSGMFAMEISPTVETN